MSLSSRYCGGIYRLYSWNFRATSNDCQYMNLIHHDPTCPMFSICPGSDCCLYSFSFGYHYSARGSLYFLLCSGIPLLPSCYGLTLFLSFLFFFFFFFCCIHAGPQPLVCDQSKGTRTHCVLFVVVNIQICGLFCFPSPSFSRPQLSTNILIGYFVPRYLFNFDITPCSMYRQL